MKQYFIEIKIEWGHTCQAETKEEAIQMMRDSIKDSYDIDVTDDEIISVIEEELNEE